MKYNLGHITFELQTEGNGLHLKTDLENWFIPIQTIEETSQIIEKNYGIVKDHFKNKIGQIISETDLENVCFNIVLHYFQMYNHWRTMYKRETKRDLTFLQNDFEHPHTSYHIVNYFKKCIPTTMLKNANYCWI